VRIATEGFAVASDGSPVRIEARSICLHGDTLGAVAVAAAVRAALEEAGVEVRAVGPT
jgi:5-oxoprolinase (ATP-hydrolysing) subunit A